MSHKLSANFNGIAPFYDMLARMVFGKSIKKSQLAYLNHVPTQANVLIIGGGTGWIVNELLLRAKPGKIDYVEQSKKMLNSAKQRLTKREYTTQINFIHGNESAIPENEQYDVIITNFFLDIFTYAHLKIIVDTLYQHLKPGGGWIVTDFDDQQCKQSWWKQTLIKFMYFFFRMTTGLEGNKLHNFGAVLEEKNMRFVRSTPFFHNMIFSGYFVKQ